MSNILSSNRTYPGINIIKFIKIYNTHPRLTIKHMKIRTIKVIKRLKTNENSICVATFSTCKE